MGRRIPHKLLMKKKKILCLIDSLGAGGAQRQMVGLASFLKERGYDVIVAFYHEELFYADNLLSKGVPYVYLKKAESSLFRIFQISKYIRRIKPDVVISYLENPSICACIARLFNNSFKLITSERNTTQNTGKEERIRFGFFRLADYVVPNAFAQADYIHKSFPFLSKKVITIPNFVDVDYFTPPIVRKRRTIPEVMVAATIWPSKNTLGFVNAISQLKDKGYRFHVRWYGKDEANIDYYNACQQKIDELGVGEFLELKEKTTQIRDKYQDSDYFCLPSFYEGTPNVICEAMACGLPIACSNVCDNCRYVANEENGFVFNPLETSSIVEAMERMLFLNEKDYASFCSCSREKAIKIFSKDRFVDSYIKLIEQ